MMPNPIAIAAIKRAARENGVAWQPLAAIDYHESGLDPTSIGDNGTSFGLSQLHIGGALPRGTPRSQALDPYWNASFQARAVKALGIQGLSPVQQIAQISRRFERPADPSTEIARATAYYRQTLAGMPSANPLLGSRPPAARTTATQPAGIPAVGTPQPTAPAPAPDYTFLQRGLEAASAAGQRAQDAFAAISGRERPVAPTLNLAAMFPPTTLTPAPPSAAPVTPHLPGDKVIALKGSSPHTVPDTKGLDRQGKKAVALAKQFLGTPYLWGGAKPGGFDCSGLLQYVWAKNGVSIPRVAADQFKAGRAVNPKNLQPGDALAFTENGTIGHIGMYIGNGQFIHAPHTGDHVKISALAGHYQSILAGARRFA